MSEFGIAEREKERIKYCEMLFACVEKLNTDENINLVNQHYMTKVI